MAARTTEPIVAPSPRVRPGRESLLRTAVALMGEHGYEGTSTRQIAAAAGVSVAALYYHFPSKLDLLRQFMHEAHDVVLARLERDVDAAGDDVRARLDAAVGSLIAASLHDPFAQLAAQVAWREHGRLDEPDRRGITDKREQMVDLIEGIISAGVAEGRFTTTEPREAARAVLTLCVSVVAPFSETGLPLLAAIEVHQRFAVALANTEPGPTPTAPTPVAVVAAPAASRSTKAPRRSP